MNAFDTHALFVCNNDKYINKRKNIPNHVSKNLNSFLINLIIQSALTHININNPWFMEIGHTKDQVDVFFFGVFKKKLKTTH